MTNEEMEKAIEKGEMTTELAIQLLSETGLDCMYEEATQEALDMAIKALEQTRWISVSERLPKDNQTEYLVTYKAKGREWINIGFCDEGFWYIYSNDSSPTMEVNVTAWMPLPQPYKAESEE